MSNVKWELKTESPEVTGEGVGSYLLFLRTLVIVLVHFSFCFCFDSEEVVRERFLSVWFISPMLL